MDENFSTQRLLLLRKLTRSIAELLRGQVKDYLSTVAPLLRPKTVLGEYVQGAGKEMVRGSEKAFKELQELYERIAPANPFNLPKELNPPLVVINPALEIAPFEYRHEAKTERESKIVNVISPFKWTLSYSGFAPARLRELLASRSDTGDDVLQFVLHYLMLRAAITHQAGVAQILEALHFPVTTEPAPEFGELPVTYICSAVSSALPPDDVIIESTEISGRPVFEEVVRLEDISRIEDPLKARLVELVKSHGNDILP
jgi:hypothetical protein